MGTSRSTGRSTIVSATSAYTANGAICSRARESPSSWWCPHGYLLHVAQRADELRGMRQRPVMGGSPKGEPERHERHHQKVQVVRGPLARLFPVYSPAGRNVHLHVHQQREERPGTAAQRGASSAPRRGPHPRAATIRRCYRRRYREHLQPVTPLPHATSVQPTEWRRRCRNPRDSRMNAAKTATCERRAPTGRAAE